MSEPTERTNGELFLLDGNSLAYRAFFALPESMATSDGRPTNALFGFASMLTKILTEHRPAGLAVAWDAGMSGREEVYPEYKSQRPPRPDLLAEQWPHLMPMVEAFGYANVRVEGYEADDVLATLAERASEQGIAVVVVSGDRDVYQLVRDGVRVMTTGRGVTDTKMYDRQAVIDRWGVAPELVTDLIGLKGDTSDNIPGVPGIGEKTAASLLQEFGSLEDVLTNAEAVSGAKRRENLAANAEAARISKQLATAERDLDLDVDPKDLMGVEPDRSALRELARDLELREVLKRLEEGLPEGEEVPGEEPGHGVVLETRQATLSELPEGPLALAAEGDSWAASAALSGREADQPSFREGDAVDGAGGRGPVLVGRGTLDELVAALVGRPLVLHDAKSVGGGRHGLLAAAAGQGAQLEISHDTMIAAYLLNPSRRSYELAELALDEGLEMAGEEDPEAGQMALADDAESDGGPAAEADLISELAARQVPRLEAEGLTRLLADVELPLVPVLAAMERRGVKLDVERLDAIATDLDRQLAELESEIHRLAGREFTIGSPQQVGQVLFEELGLTRKRRGKTGYSTDARVLAQIHDEHPIVAEIERWRELSKLKTTYLDALPELVDPETGRLHTTFNQVAAATGRLSSIAPNLQNIPIRTDVGRPIRGCFVAEPGAVLLAADYSQVELRVLAHVAGEEVLKEVFRAGDDVHAATAAEVFGVDRDAVEPEQRSKAKMVNFGIIYGLTGFGLADRLNIPRQEGDAFVARYLERFPAVRSLREQTIESATELGYVTTVMGRRRPIPELGSGNAQTRQLGERLAINSVVQGSAADIIKVAMNRADRALDAAGLRTSLILQIHDELLFEGPEGEVEEAREIVRSEMVGAFDLDPPLEVELGVGGDWLDAK